MPLIYPLNTTSVSVRLLQAAAQARGGIVLPVRDVPTSNADVPGIFNAAVPGDVNQPWQGTAGAVAFGSAAAARQAAVAEALERYAAARGAIAFRRRYELGDDARFDLEDCSLFSEAQQRAPHFPWPAKYSNEDRFVQVFHALTNEPRWVPQELVSLGLIEADNTENTMRVPSTSSGLAAMTDGRDGVWLALLRALEEVLERDALAITWLHGLRGQRIALPAALADMAQVIGATVCAVDLTQTWNPHPVIAVLGEHRIEGRPRYAFGIACRATVYEATQKAWLEWAQSLRYADYAIYRQRRSIPADPQRLRRFDEHAVYYTAHPAAWQDLPLLSASEPSPAPSSSTLNETQTRPNAQLHALLLSLKAAGIDCYYRELTCPDVAAAGLRVMRVLCPALTPLHADERAPFLGGRFKDIAWRYPKYSRALTDSGLNPWPHPLG